jgi:hypothetical protein
MELNISEKTLGNSLAEWEKAFGYKREDTSLTYSIL